MQFSVPDRRDRGTGALAPGGQSIAPGLSGSSTPSPRAASAIAATTAPLSFASASSSHQPFSGRQNAEFRVSSRRSLLRTDRWEAVGSGKDRGRASGRPTKESFVSADRIAGEFERGAGVCSPYPRGRDCVRSSSLADGALGASLPGVPRSGAGGPQRHATSPGPAAWATRGRSTSAAALRTSGPANQSRAAVIGATSSRRPEPAGLADPIGVDGGPGSQSPVVCGPSAARLANTPALFAVGAPHYAGLTGTAATLSSLARIAIPLLTVDPPPISAQAFRVDAPFPPAMTASGRGLLPPHSEGAPNFNYRQRSPRLAA